MQGGDIPPIANIILTSILTVELSILVYSIMAIFQKEKTALLLWGRWTVVTLLGFLAAEFLSLFIMDLLGFTQFAFVAGAVLGFAQWFVLRDRLDKAGYWILATAIGCMAGLSITEYGMEPLLGLFLGAIQVLVLGPQYRGSAWWILASTAGIGYWIWISPVTTWPTLLLVVTLGLSPIVYGALTGIALAWFIRKHDQTNREIK